ncbi:alpha/beta hydrolase [Flavobacterium sp.]|jgi:phospholipase/carboxylesterase|uniref:alpha/beta hydrolase n=1 Tax=Flavobacterium sp. TaxID=239 RepID=UPI0037C1323E
MSLHYLVREPKIKLEKNPALVLLHGYGSNEEDLFSFASELPEDHYVISVQAPYALQGGFGYAWYAIYFDADENKFSDDQQAKESIHLIAQFLDEITSKLPIDKQKISLIGFSQGAILSYGMAFTYPEKVSKIVALSGYFNEKLLPESFDVNKMQNIKFFASHGSVDQVIPVEWARKTQPYLEKLGLPITYKEYPVGHGVASQNFWDFKNWLEQN